MTKDIIILGGFAGFTANIAKSIIAWTLKFLGLTEFTFEHIAAGTFVTRPHLMKPWSLVIGFISDYTIASALGVIMYLILKKSGFDYALVKGTGFGALFYVLFFGLYMSGDLTRTTLATPIPNLVLFFPHVIFGIILSWLIKKFYFLS